VVRRQLLQRYEHQPFVSCLAGLYGCQWRRYQRAKPVLYSCRCNFGKLGFWFPWSVVLLVLAAALFTYIALLLVLAVCLLSEGQRLYLHWSHKIGILVTLCFSISATAVLSDLRSKEWTTLLLSFQVTAPFLHVGGVSLMTFLSWPIALHFFRMNKRVRQVALLSLFLAVLFALYLVPLGMYSPCIKEEGTLGPAPTLIGHRGAPMLAPENTQMSFEKAVGAGGEGLETDVTISYDGVPFLMHDRTLRRTTNIQQVFPNRTDAPAAMFTWPELEMLSAGSWFLQRDPFSTVSSLDADERVRVQNQTVPSLKDLLNLAAQHERLVIFDLRRPPQGHPYRDSWITRTLEVIHNESSINSSQVVLWLPADQRSLVQELDPELQQTSGDHASIEELQEEHIVRLNLHYSYMSQEQIRKYASVNISTNLYVISQPWLYSLAWCAGVHSVTTNAPHKLKTLQRPLFLMTPDEYSLMWILTDIVSTASAGTLCSLTPSSPCMSPLCMASPSDPPSLSLLSAELSDVWSISSISISVHREAQNSPVTPSLPTISEEPPV
uniref:GP-PDE domain-containing protein n=1 Tax=Sinocyclocheilus grahami TaxID=75366 RepID=A0A672RVV7_SINGR